MWDYFAVVGIIAHVIILGGVGLYALFVGVVKKLYGA